MRNSEARPSNVGAGNLETALDETGIGIWKLQVAAGRVTANASFRKLVGAQTDTEHDSACPGWIQQVHPADRAQLLSRHQQLLRDRLNDAYELEFRVHRPDGSLAQLRGHSRVTERGAAGEPFEIAVIVLEASHEQDLMRARDALRAALQQLAIAARLGSVGELAAGVAHEINTPAQYVSDSLHFIRETVHELLGYCDRSPPAPGEGGARDLSYIRQHLPAALDASIEGMDRIAEIVRSMKDFSSADRREMRPLDLNRTIQSTLVVAQKQYKDVAEVKTFFDDLPPVTCHPGDINQVLVNLISNAADAIRDVVQGPQDRGYITVTTRREVDKVVVTVADTGRGIPQMLRDRVFDPFFTTKEAGRGMGLGLSISRNIARKHHGTLTFDTAVDRGTTFSLRLPLDPAVT